MASQTDDAERRVREQRALIQRKVEHLEERVGDDVAHARDRVQYHLTHAADMLPGGPELIGHVEQHPVIAMAGGMGVGVAAGMLQRRESHNQRADVGNDGGSMGMVGALMGTLSSSVMSPLRPYVEDAAKQMIAGFADRQREHANAEGSRAAQERAQSEGR